MIPIGRLAKEQRQVVQDQPNLLYQVIYDPFCTTKLL